MLLEEHKEVMRLRTLVEGTLGHTAALPDNSPADPVDDADPGQS
jgi:hypothetical protein